MNQRIFFIFFSLLAVFTSFNVQTCDMELPATAMVGTEVEIQEAEATVERMSLGYWTITGYCGCEICCGYFASAEYRPNGTVIGASGRELIPGYSCATNSLPLGTIIYIEGLGTFRVDDRGTVGIDLYYETHEEASLVGRQYREIFILGGDSY